VSVTLSDEPKALLTATTLNLPVQDAGLAAVAGTQYTALRSRSAVFFRSMIVVR